MCVWTCDSDVAAVLLSSLSFIRYTVYGTVYGLLCETSVSGLYGNFQHESLLANQRPKSDIHRHNPGPQEKKIHRLCPNFKPAQVAHKKWWPPLRRGAEGSFVLSDPSQQAESASLRCLLV